MATASSAPTTAAATPPLIVGAQAASHRPSARPVAWRRPALTAGMVVLAVLWLLPAVWVFVTSLKLTQDIVRVPPEWIPWPATVEHYGEVLFSSSRTARIGRGV